ACTGMAPAHPRPDDHSLAPKKFARNRASAISGNCEDNRLTYTLVARIQARNSSATGRCGYLRRTASARSAAPIEGSGLSDASSKRRVSGREIRLILHASQI